MHTIAADCKRKTKKKANIIKRNCMQEGAYKPKIS